MTTATTYDELYDTIGTIVQSVTGRDWWRRTGMQSQPRGSYAVVYLAADQALQHQVVENVELDPPGLNDEVYEQKPWGTATIDCVVEFYRDAINDSANQAASRFRNSLYIEKRFEDLWRIAGLIGNVRWLDISGAFRADIEPRAEVRFSFIANITNPGPDLTVPGAIESNQIYDIQSQQVDVTHVKPDGSETIIQVDVDPTP